MMCLLAPISAHAQLDSIAKARNAARRAFNTTKLELLYETVNRTTSSRGMTSEYQVTYQLVSINGKKPVEIDKRGSILRQYYNRCWEARELLDQGNKSIKKGNRYLWSGLLVGTAVAFSGFIANPEMKGWRIGVGFGMGLGTMLTGAGFWGNNRNKGRDLIHKSVDVYNAKCYAFPDSVKPSGKSADKSTTATPGKTESGLSERKYVNNTVYYDLLRNDPANSDFAAIAVNLATVDLHGLNINIKGGLGLLYTYKSKFSISADYQISYLDNPKADKGSKNEPYSSSDVGGPFNYRHSNNLDISMAYAFSSWTKEGGYKLGIGNKRLGGRTAEVVGSLRGDVQKAFMLRAGYQIDNRLVQSDNEIKYVNSSPAYIYHHEGDRYEIKPVLGDESSMFKAGIITAGLGYSTFRDLKIRLVDSEYQGERQVKKQTDLYADAMYAHQAQFQDMLYWSSLMPYSRVSGHVSQRLDISKSPVSRLGFRTGARINGIGNIYGLRGGLEAGLRPGPKAGFGDNAYLSMNFGILFGRSINR